jgi:two-component system NtrC family response regulator
MPAVRGEPSSAPTPTPARTLEDVEMEHILKTLDKHEGRKQPAAAELGISLKTLYNKLAKLEAERKSAG